MSGTFNDNGDCDTHKTASLSTKAASRESAEIPPESDTPSIARAHALIKANKRLKDIEDRRSRPATIGDVEDAIDGLKEWIKEKV